MGASFPCRLAEAFFLFLVGPCSVSEAPVLLERKLFFKKNYCLDIQVSLALESGRVFCEKQQTTEKRLGQEEEVGEWRRHGPVWAVS